MMPDQLLRQAPYHLRGCLGEAFASAYRSGKMRMADCLLGELQLPQQQTYEMIDELERRGAVRFEQRPDLHSGPPETGVWWVAAEGEAADAPDS